MTWYPRRLHLPTLLAASAAVVVLSSCSQTGASTADAPRDGDSTRALRHVPSDPTPGHCEGSVGPVSVDGDITVPAGATCELLGTTVDGNVSIGHGARLYARGVDVDGDVEGEGTALVEVSARSHIGGNLQLGSGGSATVRDSHVDGDLSLEDQRGALSARDSTVRGNLEASGNRGAIVLSRNRVGGDLSCLENDRTPLGGGNIVGGDREDQCRGR